ncbi:MAG TPA: ATP synthase F1 subunit epsilon [Lacipirellulaceae bacterium]|nr:ATP synthase F1 subunit epsilon [Lacipirellulaceae bacterium]
MAEQSHAGSTESSLCVVVVTPEQTVFDLSTDFVALPLYDGELGVAPGHAPMIGRLGYGELRIGHEPAIQRIYIDGGFVQVAGNVVSVLTNRAIPAKKLDVGSLKEAIAHASRTPAAGDDQIARREKLLTQARAQLRVAEHAAGA